MFDRYKNYRRDVDLGYSRMKQVKVALCSIVRDCGKALRYNIPVIEQLRTCFKESYVVVVENDSVDDTADLLNKWVNNSRNVLVQSEVLGAQTQPDTGNGHPAYSKYRIEHMAMCRNKYLALIEDKLNDDIDCLIVIDLDVKKIIIDGIANTFGKSDTWHAVSSNGITPTMGGYEYYDLYALKEVGDCTPMTIEKMRYYRPLYSTLKKGMPMIQVASAFSGMAIYKTEAIANLRYSCRSNEDGQVRVLCEHMALHEDMARNGHPLIFINPSQIVYYDTRPSYYMKKLTGMPT